VKLDHVKPRETVYERYLGPGVRGRVRVGVRVRAQVNAGFRRGGPAPPKLVGWQDW